MHISEGVLSPAVLAGGAGLAVVGTAIGLKKLDYEAIPRVAILSAAFFVASLIHVPVGPVGLHLVLNGLLGLFLGCVAVPAILIGLFLQALLFQFRRTSRSWARWRPSSPSGSGSAARRRARASRTPR